MVVQHNLAALNANRMLGLTTQKRAKTSEKLASGYKINRAADDAAGLSISEKMRKQIRGLDQGARNTQDGISFVQVGDGAMHEIHNMLQRMNELSIQAANGTNSESDRTALDEELQQIKSEINRVGNTTKFNELNVFDNHTVIFNLTGVPKDLEIFNATYDDTGKIATYGGFVFHGERVPWNDISQGMVKTDANGKQVFVGGSYSYESLTTGYKFEFRCKDGDELPLVTREISIAADKDGIILGGERFAWSEVRDTSGKRLSADNLHAGPWSVNYYGARFTFTVPEPVVDIESLAEDVNAKKSATVYYDWEGSYGYSYTEEKAVNVYGPDVVTDYVTQANAYNMYNAQKDGVEFTVKADDDGVSLWTNQGTELAGSKKTWEELGIDLWDDGMTTPGYENGQKVNEYVYKDDSTGLEFKFYLSNITSKDSVIDGLNDMKFIGEPLDTVYTPTLTVNSAGAVKGASVDYSNLYLTFGEEIDATRDFDDEDWSMNGVATYATSDDKLTFTFAGGYKLVTTGIAEDDTYTIIDDYMSWVHEEKRKDVLNGGNGSSVIFSNYTGDVEGVVSHILDHPAGGTTRFTYTYDYTEILKNLTDNVSVWMEPSNYKSIDQISYVKENNAYISTQELYDRRCAEIDEDASIVDKDTAKTTARKEILNMDMYIIQQSYVRENGVSTAGYTEMIDDARDVVGADIAAASDLSLVAESYSRLYHIRGDENANVAHRPVYNSYLRETPLEEGLRIVHSAEPNDYTGIPRFAMNTVVLSLAFSDIKTEATARETIANVDAAIKYVSEKRSYYGALQNRLEHTMKNLENVSENTQAAESRIRDADMAKEMVLYSRDNILVQAGQAMLAQANQIQQGIINILRI